MDDKRINTIQFNENLIRRAVYAINKAVSEDVPQELRQNRLETNNRCKFAAGDHINDNLRHHVVDENIDLIPFKRFVWEGRILVDHTNKITYTIASFATLAAAPKKHGNKPYYLQSILFAENGDCEGFPKQMTLAGFAESMGFEPFTTEEFTNDFNTIMQGAVNETDGYRHYILGYTAMRSEITEIRLLYLDKDFAEVDSRDLMDYVTPDFASLTNSDFNVAETDDVESDTQHRQPMKLKPGLKPALRALEEEA